MSDFENVNQLAIQIINDIDNLPKKTTAIVRALRKQYSRQLKSAPAEFVFQLADELIGKYRRRWLAYELIHDHKTAFYTLDASKLEALGHGMNSWHNVDEFARTLSGPAWLNGQINDEVIQKWVRSPDLWWRRAALVSTVALNMRSQGGYGDTERTLAICRELISDHEDMVVKALSWALRELVIHDSVAVCDFLNDHDAQLAARVKREVNNKLTTGVKNPKK